jgi:hypothetical protein
MPKKPTEAIADLVSEELRVIILGLPESLKDSVPDRLKCDTRIMAADETRPKEKKRSAETSADLDNGGKGIEHPS